MKTRILFLSIFSTPHTLVAEFLYLHRSPEALLMGDAYTAVADDSNTLFYNPAALGRHRGVTLSVFNPAIAVTDLLDKDIRELQFEVDGKYKDWPKNPEGIARKVLGIPFQASLAGTPTIKMEQFALSFLANSKTRMILENSAHPNINLDYRLDRGFLVGYALRFGGARNRTSLGFTLKKINRNGLRGRYDLFSTDLIELTEDSDDYKDLRKKLGYSRGDGWGGDIGIEQVLKVAKGQLVLGASYLDVGQMHFKKEEGTGVIPHQESSLNLGLAYSQDFALLDYTLSGDYKNVIDPFGNNRSKFSLGARLDFPLLDLYLGWNGGHTSYGFGLDFFMFEILAGFYGVETGYDYRQREGERALVLFKLLDIHFDP